MPFSTVYYTEHALNMDYQLENLGPEKFQHLAQALLAKEQPNVQYFPIVT